MKLSRRRSQILRRLCVAVVTTFAAAGLVPLAGSGAAAATWSVPKFVQSMGGIGRAGIYAWGMDYNPVTREIVVSDYQNFRVRRYTQSGSWIADLPDQKGEAWDVASDPITGEVFVADHRQKKVHRYAKDGSFIGSWSTSSQVYAAWLDVDRNGDVWIVDSADWSTAGAVYVNKYSKEGTRLATWPVTVPFEKSPTVFGIGVSSAGEVFLPDGNNRRIHVFTTSGSYVRSFGSEGSGVGGLSGDLRGMALDEANEVLYVSDTGSNQIEKFAFGGSPLAHWGGMANTADRLQAPRDLTVDAEGDVWVADYGNHRFREFAPDGSQIGVYPQPSDAESNGHFGQARDVHVDSATGDVWVVDTANQHFTRLGSDGAFKGIWGRRGFGDYGLNYPSTIAFEPTYGRVWVANEEGRNIKVYDATGTYQFMIGQQAKTPENRGIMVNPTDIDFRGQRAYVTDEGNTLMQVFDVSTGAKLLEFPIRTHRVGIYSHHGTGIDPVSGDLYVVNHREDRVEVFTADGARKFMFGARGLGDGQFQMPRRRRRQWRGVRHRQPTRPRPGLRPRGQLPGQVGRQGDRCLPVPGADGHRGRLRRPALRQ